MATVKFSEKLRVEVRDITDRMRIAEIGKHAKKSDIHIVNDDPRVLDFAFGEHTNLWGVVPESWLVRKEYIILRAHNVPADDGTKHSLSCRIFPATGHFLFPAHHGYIPEIVMHGGVGPWVEFANEANTSAAHRDISDKWNHIQQEVVSFFRSFPTVNAAIKHAPSMAMYLPQDVINRMEEKVERSKPTAPTISVDVGTLVGAAAVHRLGV